MEGDRYSSVCVSQPISMYLVLATSRPRVRRCGAPSYLARPSERPGRVTFRFGQSVRVSAAVELRVGPVLVVRDGDQICLVWIQCSVCVCAVSPLPFGCCRLVGLSDHLLSPRGFQRLVVARYMPSLESAGFRGGPQSVRSLSLCRLGSLAP